MLDLEPDLEPDLDLEIEYVVSQSNKICGQSKSLAVENNHVHAIQYEIRFLTDEIGWDAMDS